MTQTAREERYIGRSYLQISPREFVIDKHYSFEGISDPADEVIVYAISSPKIQFERCVSKWIWNLQ